MKKILTSIILLSAILAQDRKFAILVDFTGEDVDDMTLRIIPALLEISLIESNRFTVIGKNLMEKILGEQQFQSSCLSDEACAVEIGRLVNAEYLILGEIIGFPRSLYQMNIKIINIEKGDVAEKITRNVTGKVLLVESVEGVSQDIVRRIASDESIHVYNPEIKYPKPKMPPTLALEIEFKEPSGNNYLDAEETGEIQIKIINNGKGEAYGMETTVSIMEIVNGLLLEDAAEKIKTDQINPEEFAIISKKVSASESISSDKITFEINVTEFNGFDLYPSGRLVIETKALIPPDLQLVDIGINDLTNFNGRIDPNEVVEAKAIIQNKGQGIAKGVTVSVMYGDNVYNAGEAEFSFSLGDMEANETKEIDFSFFANRNASNDLPIELSIKEQRGKYDRALRADLALNKVIKKATEVIVAGKDEGLITITDASLLSIDIEKNIPNTKMKNKNGIAVVIGNREYSGDVPDVEFAVRDAEYVKEYLIQTLGYRPGNIFYITDATLSNMKVAFNELKNAVKKGKSDVFVYYSGHGAPDPDSKQGYFVPVDANPNHISISGYPVDDLYAILNQTGARSTTVVIDACFSGSSDQGMILKDISPVFIEVDKSLLTIDNSTVFTSATGEQVSSWYRDKKHSLFTYYFLKALQGDADSNDDDKLTMSEIKVYVDENVPYMARHLNNRVQTPQLITDDQTKIMVTY